MKKSLLYMLLIVTIGSTLLFFGCDKRGVDVPDYTITYLGSNADSIYADDNTDTYATIRALVKDGKGNPVVEQAVKFTCTIGQINQSVTTDETGTATATFQDMGMIGSSAITASIAASKQTITVKIVEPPVIYISSIYSDLTQLYADGNDETFANISAVVMSSEGTLQAEQTVTFTSSMGQILMSAVSDETGTATVQFYDLNVVGVATIVAKIDQSTRSLDFPIVAAPAKYVARVTAVPGVIYRDNDETTYAEIRATVRDSSGILLTGETVTFNTDLGEVTASATSNESGVAVATFGDAGDLGTATVTATLDNSTESVTVQIEESPKQFITKLEAYPAVIYSDNDESTYTTIKATVRDSIGTLLVGETVTFNSDLGEITASVESNEMGVATATLHDAGDLGDATITATIGESVKTIVVPIEEPPAYVITTLTATPNVIYADNNLTYSTIRAVVRDEDNFAVAGEAVRFRILADDFGYSIGNLISDVDTDSSGIAETIFWDQGDEGTATIEAIVGVTTAQVSVEVLPVPVVASVIIDTTSIPSINIDQVRAIRATAKNENDEVVEDGTLLTFETTKGFFQDTADDGTALGTLVSVETVNGIGTAYYNGGETSGSNTITAAIGEVSDARTFDIYPGSPNYILMESEQDTIQVNSSEEIWIRAKVKDRYGNPVTANRAVTFESSIGSITSPNFTNAEGFAQASFSSGLEAGLAEISSVCDSASGSYVVNIISDDVHQLTYEFPGQIDMSLVGTGGMSTYELKVNLWDMNGNPYLDNKEVFFKFAFEPPNDCNFNNMVYSEDDTLFVTSVNGVASVAVNSGNEAGVVTITAGTTNNNGRIITATRSNIVIHAGHPAAAEVGIGEYDTGENSGSGTWTVGVNAIISDAWGNPVDYGTAAWFSIVNADEITWATIIAEAYVGNPNTDGDSLQGVAFTTLIYDGSHSLESIQIMVNCGDLIAYGDVELPLNSPTLTMTPHPGHLDWTEEDYPNPDPKIGEVLICVTDGQGSPVNNAIIHLYSARGEFINADAIYQVPGAEPWVVKTASNNLGEEGVAYARISFPEYLCPPVSPPPNEIPVDITGTIIGTEITDQCTIILLNYYEP